MQRTVRFDQHVNGCHWDSVLLMYGTDDGDGTLRLRQSGDFRHHPVGGRAFARLQYLLDIRLKMRVFRVMYTHANASETIAFAG